MLYFQFCYSKCYPLVDDLSTLFIGRSHIHLETTSSTNAYAANTIAKSSPPEGTVISTSFQTAGKGQIGRSWYASADKNVMCSIVLYPKFLHVREQFLFNMSIACAVRSTVARFIDPSSVCVKWPNDIYIKDKKIAGILIQNSLSGVHISHTITGVGLNVNETVFPSQLPNPTSLKLVQGVDFDPNNVLARLCESVERYYMMLKNGNGRVIHTEYNTFLYRKGELSSFQIGGGQVIDGIIDHVNAKGELVLRSDGKEQAFSTGNIRYI